MVTEAAAEVGMAAIRLPEATAVTAAAVTAVVITVDDAPF
jgi:hypothetical protein